MLHLASLAIALAFPVRVMAGRLHACIGLFVIIGLACTPPASSMAAARYGVTVSQGAILPEAEAKLLTMVNRERRIHGLSPLISDPSLRLAARRHAQDMALRGYVGHDSLGGQTVRDRLAGSLRSGSRVGENVAMVQSVEEGQRAFVASQHHLRNMLDPGFHRVGIGVTTAGEMGIMITEDFT